jgi:DNA-binding MarR family transcriptional regulator
VKSSADDLARRLNSATVHIGRALRRESAHKTLATEHASALGVVVFAGPLRMGDLAKRERVGAPAMTKTVAVLERAGLVRRTKDPGDDRAVLIRATPAATRMVLGGRDERVRRIARGLGEMTTSQRERFQEAVGMMEELIGILERDPH